MTASSREFRADLRMSLTPIVLLQHGLASFCFFASGGLAETFGRPVLLIVSLLFYIGAALTWLAGRWRAWLGRWVAVLVFTLAVSIGSIGLPIPGIQTLFLIPTGLAVVLIGLSAGALVAGVTTALAILLPGGLPDYGMAPAIIAAIGIWSVVGLMAGITGPVLGVADWAWGHYLQARELLAEARRGKAQLEQALEDLARANVQLTRFNKLAAGLQQAADESRKAKEEFVANVSHELRTPLNMIVGFTEMIMQSPKAYGRLSAALLADLSVIHRNARHLADLIDDVLDLSQIEAGQMALSKEHVSASEIVEAAVEAVRPLYQSKGLYLRVDFEPDLPPVFCDRTRIREVALNLLSNAGRFTETGGVAVRVWRELDDLFITVADTGRGIAAGDLGKLFQPFQQADGSIRRLYGGTGLGLSISKRLLELHGGKIGVESQVGVGTIFTLRLPLLPPVRLPPGPGVERVRGLQPGWEYLERTGPSLAPRPVVRPRWVVLETGKVLTRLLTRYGEGVEIVPTADLTEALAELAAGPSQALIVNDASVGAALQRVRAAGLPRGAPALICSVPGAEGLVGWAGVAGYLVKPIARETLLAALDRAGLHGKTILVVDDEPEALRLYRRMLASADRNYRVLRAADGEEALKALRDARPSAVLLDLVMPNVDGFHFLEAKSQDPALAEIPVIVVSAQDSAGQPVVSSALAVTAQDGLSAPRLLACFRALTEILTIGGAPADRAP
ncbi:MAG: Hybrid sensor histidine kinase/response regulator [Chloroflexota bacterium]|nr:Hybrid sensor histidine kinase/response regulator [Chloroflexota bacterium]